MSDPKFECGIVLHPAGHTRSPAMHRAAYQQLGLDASYTVFDVSPDQLASSMVGFRSRGLRQLAVSIPHKEAMIGAINTATLSDGRFVGTNTDWIGALRALEREIEVKGQRAVILGAGGTARALVYVLRKRGCEVFVLNRTRARADALVEELGATSAGPLGDLGKLAPQIIVNTTSVGLNESVSPVAADTIPANAVVLDVVYSPSQTRFLLDAAERGARTIGGKWMLVYQAVEQLRRWTGLLESPPQEADLAGIADVMAEAFDAAGAAGA